jgi:hypothetical protein
MGLRISEQEVVAYFTICMKRLRKITDISIRTTDNTAEILAIHLTDTSVQHSDYIRLLAPFLHQQSMVTQNFIPDTIITAKDI